ncbi:ATP/GTP-binding protein [Mucilaginibacter sp. MD40]|uniref:AAA family ATPase n=1 Tax=Mucilaginibacter sp. MD40 TaxID=2029590 RepID=UPI00130476D6|nr:ATP-binding protein [Mucilaginibacter sp. MD40]
MLIRFTVENFLSFNQETEFNMLTGEVRRLPNHVFSFSKVDLLKSAVIYGANGAGKSNLVTAINVLRHIILDKTVNYIPEDSYFRLDQNEDKPTTFEIEFLSGKNGYAYGISVYKSAIVEEWMFKLNFGKKPDDIIFERKLKKGGQESLKMGDKYSKTPEDKILIKVYEDILEADKPFLTTVKEKKFKEIQDARHWLETGMFIIFPRMHFSGLVNNFLNDDRFKSFTNELICNLETGIKEIDVQTIDFDLYFGEDNSAEKDRVLKKIRGGESESVGDFKNALAMIEGGKPVVKKPVSYHADPNGKKVKFELYEESDGTLRLIDFIPLLFLIKNYQVTVIIDEIDQSIHPSLLKEFVTKIQNDSERFGQLIFTTHESNLLDLDLFRQDEIWFAEKSKGCSSQFYVLSDYDVRTDFDIRKGYLSGRFGAIPFLGNLKDLKWGQYVEE